MAIKVLDYNGLKQLTSKFKDYVNEATSGKADDSDLTKLVKDLEIQDTRDKNENPTYYIKNKSREIVKEFKTLKVIGVNSSSDYCVLITMFPWQDNSVGYPVQMAFILKSDEIYTRRGTSDTAWGKWRKILDDTDLKTKLSQLSQDSTHRLVTDAEKAEWNAKAENSYVDSAKASADENAKTLTDALAKDLRENVDNINATKADKSVLNNYVEKVSGKGLSTNDFTNDYKSNIDKNLRDDAQVMRLALKVARRDTLFKSNELYKDLNNYYGTSISSSIMTLDQFQKSPTAMTQLLNNEVAKREMNGDLAYSGSIFAATMPYFIDSANQDELKTHLQDEFKAKAIYSSAKFLKAIIDDDNLYNMVGESKESTDIFTRNCPYVKSVFLNNKGTYQDDLLKAYLGQFEDHDILLLAAVGDTKVLYPFRQFVDRDGERNSPSATQISANESYDATWLVRELNLFLGDDIGLSDIDSAIHMYNVVKANGYVKTQFDKTDDMKIESLTFGAVFLDLTTLEQDLARGL